MTRHRLAGSYPAGYINDLKNLKEPIKFLSDKQIQIIDKYFDGDDDVERRSFEDFGKGVLYDDKPDHKRLLMDKIHKMDSGWPTPPVGYHRWHAFIRATTLLNEGPLDRWLQLDRHVALAWVIQSVQIPRDSDATTGNNPSNPEIDPQRLDYLRSVWLDRSFEELDSAFDCYMPFDNPFPPKAEVT